MTVRVAITMDAESQAQVRLSSANPRLVQVIDGTGTWYYIEFDDSNWDSQVRVVVGARDDADNEDPFNAVIHFSRDEAGTVDPGNTYVFPNIRSGLGATPVTVIDDETADVIPIESGLDTIVQKCGNDPCTLPGTGDEYTIRLTKRPDGQVEVAVLMDGLSDVVSIGGSAVDPLVDYEVIGGLIPSQRFDGYLDISGTTLTRGNGSDLGSFFEEGFADGDLIEVRIEGDATRYRATIVEDGTAEDTLDLAWVGTPAPAGIDQRASIFTLHTQGTWEGDATVEAPEWDGVADLWEGWTLVRDEGGWLADGFLEGQWVEICESDGLGNCAGTVGRFKVQVIRGTNTTKDDRLELRYARDGELGPLLFADDLTGFADGSFLVNRIAAVATFDDTNWFVEQEIELLADVWFRVPIARDGVKIFPVQKHGLYKLLGPVAVEGGVTGADRSLQLGLKLPGEEDGPLFKIGTQPPESKQIDVLNVFNDGSVQNRTGTLTSTHLTGLGLPGDLDFGPNFSTGNAQTFGESVIFPGGIGFGTMQFVDGTFDSNNASSTIEVVNLMLGIGNDHLDVQGTLDPDDPVKLTGSMDIQSRAAGTVGAGDAGGIDLTRPAPFDWKSQGFLVGQPVRITGFDGLEWIVLGFSDDDLTDTVDNTRMHLTGPVLTPGQVVAAPQDVFTSVDFAGTLDISGSELTRTDGGNWLEDAVTVGKRVTVGGQGTFEVTGLFDDDHDGRFERIVLDAAPSLQGIGVSTALEVVVRVVTAGDVPVVVDAVVSIEGGAYGGRVTRHDGGNWADDGFMEGQLVMIQGLTGSWRLQRVENLDDLAGDGSVLWLTRGVELPTIDPADAMRRQVFWPGPHGGLTVVHGGGNSEIEIVFEVEAQMTGADTSSVIRLDGRSWIDTGFSVGNRVQVDGAGATTWRIIGFADGDCPFDDPYPGCGDDSVMLLVQDLDGSTVGAPMPTLTAADGKHAVHVAELGEVTTTDLMDITVQESGPLGLPTTTLTCRTAGCFGGGASSSSGTVFEPGMVVHISGIAGGFTVVSVTSDELVLQGASIETTYSHVDATDPAADASSRVFVAVELTVSGTDADHRRRHARRRRPHRGLQPRQHRGSVRRTRWHQRRSPGRTRRWSSTATPRQDGVWYCGESFSVEGTRVRRQAVRPVLEAARAGERGRRVGVPAGQPVQLRRQRHHRRQRPVRRRRAVIEATATCRASASPPTAARATT